MRRQDILDEAAAKNVWYYNKMVETGKRSEPLLALVVVVNEFTEIISQKPDFVEILVTICRLRRSLQIRLLVAAQRLDAGNLLGLDSHLSYRIALKTLDASDSRAAIDIPNAAFLPAGGGHGYLKHPHGIERFYAAPSFKLQSSGELAGFSEAEAALQRMRNQGVPAHQVWLPPLDTPPTLDALLQAPLQATGDRGYTAARYAGIGRLQIPLGLVDVPYYHRQDVLMLELDGRDGHGAIVGASQSGKSNLMRTLICSMVLTHTPQEARFYVMDLGGGSIAALRNLPHVSGYSARRDRDTVHRAFTEVKGLMASREARFTELGITSMTDFRERKRRGELPDDPYGDVFVMIDGWETFQEEFELHEGDVLHFAQQGLAFGIHVFVSSYSWAAIHPALRTMLGTHLELRLGDPSESEIDPKVAINVPNGSPGRGLHWSKRHFLTALPRIDGRPATDDLSPGVTDLVNRVQGVWKVGAAPQVQLLPYERLSTVDAQPTPRTESIEVDNENSPPVSGYVEGREDKDRRLRKLLDLSAQIVKAAPPRRGDATSINTKSLNQQSAFLVHDSVSAESVTFTPDGSLLVCAGWRKGTVWNTPSWTMASPGKVDVLGLCAATGQDCLTIAGGDGKNVNLWDTRTWEKIQTITVDCISVRSLAFSPDDCLLATASSDTIIKLWSTNDWTENGALAGHKFDVRSLAFSPDGRLLASASDDMTIKIWSVRNGAETATLAGHQNCVRSVAFNRN